jgi:Flp pilus assembly protein TadD
VKALSLDNSLAEAHVVLLSTLADYDWDWEGAEREFKATAALDPNFAVAYEYYGYALLGMGRGEEALAAMKHAAELDPVSPSVQASLAWGYYLLHQDQQAVDQMSRSWLWSNWSKRALTRTARLSTSKPIGLLPGTARGASTKTAAAAACYRERGDPGFSIHV